MSQPRPPVRYGVVPREQAAALSGVEFLRRILDGELPAPPASETMGIMPLSVEVGRLVFEGRPSAAFLNPMGVVHGGWIAALLDTAMGCAVHSALDAGQAYTTIEMKTTFVRAVQAGGGPLRCEAVVLHKGGRVASAEGKVYDAEGRLVAHGTESCLVMSVRG